MFCKVNGSMGGSFSSIIPTRVQTSLSELHNNKLSWNWHKEYEGINTFSRRRTEIHPVWGHWGKIKSVHPPPTYILYLCSPHRRHERGTKGGNLVLQKINQRSCTITVKTDGLSTALFTWVAKTEDTRELLKVETYQHRLTHRSGDSPAGTPSLDTNIKYVTKSS